MIARYPFLFDPILWIKLLLVLVMMIAAINFENIIIAGTAFFMLLFFIFSSYRLGLFVSRISIDQKVRQMLEHALDRNSQLVRVRDKCWSSRTGLFRKLNKICIIDADNCILLQGRKRDLKIVLQDIDFK